MLVDIGLPGMDGGAAVAEPRIARMTVHVCDFSQSRDVAFR